MNNHTPEDPEWAVNWTDDHFMFVRDGRWHVVDADTGVPLGVLPVPTHPFLFELPINTGDSET